MAIGLHPEWVVERRKAGCKVELIDICIEALSFFAEPHADLSRTPWPDLERAVMSDGSNGTYNGNVRRGLNPGIQTACMMFPVSVPCPALDLLVKCALCRCSSVYEGFVQSSCPNARTPNPTSVARAAESTECEAQNV